MKITKSHKKIEKLEQARIKANEGCDKCPECGNKFEGLHTHKDWLSFFRGYRRIDCYSCSICGCEWESKQYKTDK